MAHTETEVVDSEGKVAVVHGVSADESAVVVLLPDKTWLQIPVQLLEPAGEHRMSLAVSFNEMVTESQLAGRDSGELRFPVVAEKVTVDKRWIETGRVRIRKSIRQKEETVEQNLITEQFDIERVAIDEVRTEPAQVRFDGDTVILPIQEEILVVEKRILVREEIRMTKRRTERPETIRVQLRSEEVTIERDKPAK